MSVPDKYKHIDFKPPKSVAKEAEKGLEYRRRAGGTDKDEPWKDRGRTAWHLWGGDPGYSWAKKVVSQMEDADKRKKMAHRIMESLCI